MRRLRLSAAVLAVVLCFAMIAAAQAAPAPIHALFTPGISPDAHTIAFVSGGDIWTVPVNGGDARILVANSATEDRPLYSPDGKYLAFTSSRTGNGDVYVVTLATGDAKQLTFDDAGEHVEAWSPDSQWVYFSTSAGDISYMSDIYRVRISGGTPMPVTADRYVNEFFAAPTPDGKSMAFSARGFANLQWWRHGHSHLDESDIWTVNLTGPRKYDRLIKGTAKTLWPMWSRDGKTLYFVSDRSGQENIWLLKDGKEEQVTHFTDGRLLWPAISANGKMIAFERNMTIWTLDLGSGKTREVPIQLVGVPATPAMQHLRLTDHIQDLALSNDGKKVVFQVHGELFAASGKEGGEGVLLSNTLAPESEPSWAPDNNRVVYVSTRGEHSHIYLYDFTAQKEIELTSGANDDDRPVFSPDGKYIAFVRDRNSLMLMDATTHQVQTLVKTPFAGPPFAPERPFVWSPDSKWIAFQQIGTQMFRNASVIHVPDGKVEPVSFLANAEMSNISWSPDGKYLLFITGQRTEKADIARVDLVPRVPRFREDQFRDLFKEQRPPQIAPNTPSEQPGETQRAGMQEGATKQESAKSGDKKNAKIPAVEVVAEGIRERLHLLPLDMNVNAEVISPDGKWLAFTADVAGHENVYIYSLDELAKEPPVPHQITSTPGPKRGVQFTPDSKEIVYLDRGRIFRTPIKQVHPEPVAVTAEMDVDFQKEKMEVFDQAWRELRDNFYDAKMHGVDWNAARTYYGARVEAARNGDEMRRIILMMIGSLNSSHSGINAPRDESVTMTGHLGLRYSRSDYENKGELKITEVVDQGPAAVAGIKLGEELVAVDGTPIGLATNLQQLLNYRIGKRTTLSIRGTDGKVRKVELKPVNPGTAKGLLYRQWVERNRAYVNKISGGKLGYVHMYDMSSEALTQLAVDLDAQNFAKEGVVIDVRNNNGGFVNAYALDVLTRKGYMEMAWRGFAPAPSRPILGQRALEHPTVLVTNRHSLSDAEDFTEGYRALHVGEVVGEPTAGWIIYTGETGLLDGSSLRLPFIRVLDHEGKDMEMHPRPVDVEVQRPIGESYTGTDSQLERAVKVLLEHVK